MREKREKGQIVIILAVAIVAIVGITALAVDGSMTYNERREDQSIADSVALAGAGNAAQSLKDKTIAESFCGKPLGTLATKAALDGAYNFAYNAYLGHDDKSLELEKNVAGTENGILVACGRDNIGRFYLDVTVIITTNITASASTSSTPDPLETRSFFRQVFSNSDVRTSVASTARVYPKQPFAWGNGLVTVSRECSNKVGGMTYEGGSNVLVKNAGILSYSCIKADANNIRVEVTGEGRSISYTPSSLYGTSYVGCKGCDTANMIPEPQPVAEQPPMISLDPPKCTNASYVNAPSSGTIYPGNYKSIKTSGDLLMKPGLYCLQGDFKNSKGNVTGERVTLYFTKEANVSLNNNCTNPSKCNSLILTAPDCETADAGCGVPPAVRGLLMYFGKPSSISVNGGSANIFEGTIYAPTSEVTLNGGSTTTTINTQIVASFIKVNGGALLEMNLEGAEMYQNPAQIDLLE